MLENVVVREKLDENKESVTLHHEEQLEEARLKV